MKDTDRQALTDAALDLAAKVQAGNVDAVKAKTIATVAANFGDMAATIGGLGPALKGASLRVTAVYSLDGSNAAPGQDEVQFFCGQAINAAHVTFAIPQLPVGRYGFAIVEATGVATPERLAMLLQNVGGAPGTGQTSGAAWQTGRLLSAAAVGCRA